MAAAAEVRAEVNRPLRGKVANSSAPIGVGSDLTPCTSERQRLFCEFCSCMAWRCGCTSRICGCTGRRNACIGRRNICTSGRSACTGHRNRCTGHGNTCTGRRNLHMSLWNTCGGRLNARRRISCSNDLWVKRVVSDHPGFISTVVTCGK